MTLSRIVPRAVSAAAFTDPLTRTLLTHAGSTTSLLDHLMNEPVQVHALALSEATVDETCPEAAAPLGLPVGAPVLVRRTTLGTAHREVSRNLVLASPDGPPWTGLLLRSCAGPLGRHLPVPHQRHPLGHGLDVWAPGRAAVAKWYLIADGASPALFVRETFNPALFDPATTGGRRAG
ncbi:hypothetical protein GCM10022224_044440 [Nonomuraea antimicrobica]|uniref:Chorismate lyase n=1 Tax=Nonomuraea antimicrobica TaxID=561173 RepID=A0ABP7C3P1_9ACTN